MPTNWTLCYLLPNGAWSPPVVFADAAIVGVTRKLVNQGIDTCDVAFANTRPPNVGPLTAGTVVRVVRDDFDGHDQFGNTSLSNPLGWFTGTVVAPKKTIAGASESASLTLNGPWWFLSQIVYQQQGLFYVPTGTVVLSGDTVINTEQGAIISFGQVQVELSNQAFLMQSSDIILTQGQADGVPMDAGETLLDALSYAMEKGARLVIGSMPDDIAIPSQALTDATCADLIKRVLRWMPSVTQWFDYKTDPPTINFATRADRAPFSLTMGGDAGQIQTATIQARPDLVLPGVTLQFLRRLNLTALISTTTTTTPAATADVPNPVPVSTTTYSANAPTNSGYVSTTKPSGTGTTDTTGATVSTESTGSSTAVNCLEVDRGGPNPDGIGALVATVQLQGGDVTSEGINQTPFEPTPLGLAAFIYAARKVLSYEGSLTLKGQEVVNLQNPLGRTLNIVGGDPDWIAMAAEIQTATENTATGATTLQLGPPNHLGPSDLAALLQANRLRQYVDLAMSILRNNGGAGLPPQNPLPPAPPYPPGGGNGGKTGPSDAPDGGTEVMGGFTGILTPYSGSKTISGKDGVYYTTPVGGGINANSYVQPTFGNVGQTVPETAQGGQADGFYATNNGDAGGGPDPYPGSGGGTANFEVSTTNTSTHSEGNLDLTSFSALAYSYAELRGSQTTSNSDGSSHTTDYTENVTGRLGGRSFYRLYASVGGIWKHNNGSNDFSSGDNTSPRASCSMSISVNRLYLLPRTS